MDAGGSAGTKSGGVSEQELADVDRMEAIDVFFGGDGTVNFCLGNMLWERGLDQNSVDGFVGVESRDEVEQLSLCRQFRKDVGLRRNPCGGAVFFLHPDI